MGTFFFFTDEISPTLEKVAQAFSQHQHEVILITHEEHKKNNSDKTKGPSLETWYYYKNYSYWEHFRLLPSLLFKKPEVAHFFIHDLNHLKSFLPLVKWLHQWPDCITSVTFLNTNDWEDNTSLFQKIIKNSDVVTFPDLTSMNSVKGFSSPKKQLRSLLPPFLNFNSEKPLIKKESSNQKQIFFAFEPQSFQSDSKIWSDLKLAQAVGSAQVLIWMDSQKYSLWDKKRLQQQLLQRRQQASILYLPLKDLESFLNKEDLFLFFNRSWPALEASQVIDACLKQKAFLILHDKQATQYSGCLKHKENCFILHKPESFKPQWSEILKLKTPSNESHLTFSTDPYINELTRIYNKALKSKELYYV